MLFWAGGFASAFDTSALTDLRAPMAARLATVNLLLAGFNLIPAFPMDGRRVLRAVLALQLPYAQATRIATGTGQGFAFLFAFLGLFGDPLLISSHCSCISELRRRRLSQG
jgi:stage IV sporulation protein FB